MNNVVLIGRLTKDPELRYGAGNQTAVCRFTIAIDRGKDRNGNDLGADFPQVVCFGKTAELMEKYIKKGRMIGLSGRIQTGSYEKNGQKIYTTEVVADRVEFLDKSSSSQASGKISSGKGESSDSSSIFDGFTSDIDLPF